MNTIELLKSVLPHKQVDAAKLLKVTQPAIHKWLTGKSRPSPRMAVAIEQATGGRVTRYELLPEIFGPRPSDQQAA
ncbi:MAG: helix-turn-helix domain-containing protein [Gammaproteobacteria bacterium]|nr:helix-turn-helix domain-containing protein [Gammaproteobacteria bacterium]